MTIEPGMFAKSKAGRDKGCIYVIIDVNAEYIYLADGAKRTVRPEKAKESKASADYKEGGKSFHYR